MQFSAVALLTLAATAYAGKADNGSYVDYVTSTVDFYTTVCPASSTLVYGGSTYTNTKTVSSKITLPCPCTIVTPVTKYSTATSVCSTTTPAAVYVSKNTTAVYAPAAKTTTSAPAGTSVAVAGTSSTAITAGAGKTMVFSGATLAGLLGLAAYIL